MIEQTHEIGTQDGSMTTFVVHPERDGPHPVILFFMDAPAIRLATDHGLCVRRFQLGSVHCADRRPAGHRYL